MYDTFSVAQIRSIGNVSFPLEQVYLNNIARDTSS